MSNGVRHTLFTLTCHAVFEPLASCQGPENSVPAMRCIMPAAAESLQRDLPYQRSGERFLDQLAEHVESSQVVIYAFVLMDNHYHSLLRTPTVQGDIGS